MLPGEGKTTWAISEMVNRMVAKEVITLYVAPSINLLNQVHADLLSAADGKVKNPKKLIRQIESTSSLKHRSGVSIPEQLRLSLEGGTPYGKEDKEPIAKVSLGSIILITHEAFLKRPKIDKTNVCVIFDEARKFVTKPEEIKLKNLEEQTWFAKILDEGSQKLLTPNGKKTEFNRVLRAKVPKDLNKHLNSTDSRLQYKAIYTIADIIKNPDIDLYVSKSSATHGRIKFRFHQVVIPSNIFVGFKEVILMSAFLKDSQMWHLLRNKQDIILSDMHQYGPYREAVNDIRYRRLKEINYRYQAITIIPLTLQNELVSLNRYRNGILVHEDAEFSLKTRLEASGHKKTISVIELVSQADYWRLSPNQTQTLADIKKYKASTDVFGWYCQTALKVVRNIKRWGKLKGSPLAVANVKYGLDKRLALEYPQFKLIPIQSHGLNTYQGHNCIFFAAAINPDRPSKHLYEALLPSYDFALDHVAEVCVQCITRSNVRDTKATGPVYVIVPDLAMAKLLYEKLNGNPSIDSRVATHYGMTTFCYLNENRVHKVPRPKVSKEQKELLQKDSNKKWREANRDLASLRSLRCYVKRQIAEGKKLDKNQQKLKLIEQKIKDALADKRR